MDVLLVEGAIAAVAALASGAGGRVLFVRSRDKHQTQAIDARRAADAAYLEFSNPLSNTALAVQTLLSQLGPHNSAAFSKESGKILGAAESLGNTYAAFAYREDGNNDPGARRKRRGYIRLTSQYTDYERKLRKRRNELEALAAKCQQLQASINSLDSTREGVERVLASARGVLAGRAEEGWVIGSFEGDLETADDLFQQALGSAAALEIITALEELAAARQQAAGVESAARELPKRRRDLLRQADVFERQRTALLRDLDQAGAGITAVTGVYATAAYASESAALAAAHLRHAHMETLIAELREDIDPARDAWKSAEATARQIAWIVDDISAACRAAMNLRTTLDQIMAGIREEAAKLRVYAADLAQETRDRDGDQKRIRKGIKKVDVQVVELIRSLDEPLPNPNQLRTRLDELSDVLNRLEQASERMDEDDWDNDDDDDTIFTSIVAGAAAAIGIDLLID